MSEMNNRQQGPEDDKGGSWGHLITSIWRTPLGLLGVAVVTVSVTLMVIGLVVDFAGLVDNPYFGVLCYVLLPMGMVLGLLLLPLSAYLRRRHWFRSSLAADASHLQINLSKPRHRKYLVGFTVVGVINMSFLMFIGYEGYHFTDSPYFCGMVCHQVMEPEYVAYKKSPHANVACVECHIGPGAQWYVKAKISGMHQLAAVLTGEYSRPVPAPVEHLRPARDTCEQCHWPEKFHGKKVKSFVSFSNDDQLDPELQEIALRIGGHNPVTDAAEGIHWHVSRDIEIEYRPIDEKRTRIGQVRVTRADGSVVDYNIDGAEAEEAGPWRTMDCIDCHNRPTHIYAELEERVDFGLLSTKIDPRVQGIREDSLDVLARDYVSREQAEEKIVADLLELQTSRHGSEFVGKNYRSIADAGKFLLETYLDNIWPAMNIGWGTYRSHLGHQNADDGFGCFRCHDEEHQDDKGEVISQDCSICHDEPE